MQCSITGVSYGHIARYWGVAIALKI